MTVPTESHTERIHQAGPKLWKRLGRNTFGAIAQLGEHLLCKRSSGVGERRLALKLAALRPSECARVGWRRLSFWHSSGARPCVRNEPLDHRASSGPGWGNRRGGEPSPPTR
jgi:hypothetical protein